jgi:hypothetical protein
VLAGPVEDERPCSETIGPAPGCLCGRISLGI